LAMMSWNRLNRSVVPFPRFLPVRPKNLFAVVAFV
jgi:hypothetical protein